MKRVGVLLAALTLALATQAHAVLPQEQLANPKLEARARKISQELRCLVCQNQTIDDYDAALASDLRVIIRERLVAGDTDEQAIHFVVQRYGDYVLLSPPFRAETLALWLGPGIVLLVGGLGVAAYLRRRSRAAGAVDPALTRDEEAEVDRIVAMTPRR
jgi:cytochrome c-type biogenesis protein CcmH